jgi:hypothetical protein
MTRRVPLKLRCAKICAAILAPVLGVLCVPGVSKSINSRSAKPEAAQSVAIDIWQLHLQAEVEGMAILTVKDPV